MIVNRPTHRYTLVVALLLGLFLFQFRSKIPLHDVLDIMLKLL